MHVKSRQRDFQSGKRSIKMGATILMTVLILLLFNNTGWTAMVNLPEYVGMQNQYWAKDHTGGNGPGADHPASFGSSGSSPTYQTGAWADTNLLKEKISGGGGEVPAGQEGLVASAEAGLWQVYKATSDSQTISLHWSGSMAVTNSLSATGYDLNSSFWYEIYTYKADYDSWSYTGKNFTWDKKITDSTTQSINVNETGTINLTFDTGTIFAIDLHMSSDFGYNSTHTNYVYFFSADFYDTGQITGVTGAQAVPIPGAVWLFGSGIMGIMAIRRRKETV